MQNAWFTEEPNWFFAYTTLNASYVLAFIGAGDSYYVNKSGAGTNDHYRALSTWECVTD